MSPGMNSDTLQEKAAKVIELAVGKGADTAKAGDFDLNQFVAG